MAEHKLKLEKREIVGKKVSGLRAKGLVPVVLYGGKEPVLAASEYVPMEKVLKKAGYHSPIDLDIDGKKKMAIVKEVQIDPVSRQILNVGFQAISAREVVEATTPITVMNFEESEAAKTYHFAMTQGITEIAVKAKPAALPKELTIDAAGLESVEDKLTLAEIQLPEGVEYADKEIDLEQVVVSLYDPAAEAEKREAAEAAEAEEAAEETEAEVATPEQTDTPEAIEEAEKAE